MADTFSLATRGTRMQNSSQKNKTNVEQDPSQKGSGEAAEASLSLRTEVLNLDALSDTPMSDEETNVPMVTEGEDLNATVVPNRDHGPGVEASGGSDLGPQNRSRKRLCGAAKRRLKALVQQGHTYDEAKRLATASHKDSVPKRQRSDGSTPESGHWAKRSRQGPTGETGTGIPVPPRSYDIGDTPTGPSPVGYSKILSGIRQGIILENFPADRMSAEQIIMLQDCIMDKVLELEGAGFTPAFYGSVAKQGWLLVISANEETADWLRTTATSLVPWEGAVLRALAADELPKSVVLTGYFPQSKESETEKILRFLKVQNPDLEIKEWKVLNRIEEGKSVLLVFLVDTISAELLKRREYLTNYRFGQVRLRTRGNSKPRPEPKPATSDTPATEAQAGCSGLSRTVHSEPPLGKSKLQARVDSSRPPRAEVSVTIPGSGFPRRPSSGRTQAETLAKSRVDSPRQVQTYLPVDARMQNPGHHTQSEGAGRTRAETLDEKKEGVEDATQQAARLGGFIKPPILRNIKKNNGPDGSS